MSSRVLPPDGQHDVSLPAWRQTPPPGGPGANQAAQRDCAAQIAQVQQQCEQQVAEARAAALREGEAAGRSRATAELQPVMERLARSIDDLAQFRPRLRREAEADMIRLSLAIARRILRREMSVDPGAMHGLVLGALERLQSQEVHRVRVHPSRAAAVDACLRQNLPGTVVEVVGDPSREPGAVIFETTHGNLDASIDCQLQEIERGLADRLNRHP
ncbi:MAG TPA: FliH/SctL family protein [Bryobacteraceae bacterium]|nr:FliH/SctL family protein [Bryobacteraceae bacterium]